MESRRLFLAVVLSFLVLLLWARLFPPEQPEPPQPRSTDEAVAPPPQETRRPEPPVRPEDAPPAEAPAEEVQPSREVGEPLSAAWEERVVVDRPRYRAELTNRGGQLLSFQLKEHFSLGRPLTWSRLLSGEESAVGEGQAGTGRSPVDLVRQRAQGPYPFGLAGPGGRSVAANDALFVVERQASGEERTETVRFRYQGAEGRVEKVFTFRADGMFDVEVRASLPAPWGVLVGPGVRNPTSDEIEDRFKVRDAVVKQGDDVERFGAQKAEEPVELPGAGLRWAALEDTYFLTAQVPTERLSRLRVEPLLVATAASGEARFERLPTDGELSPEQEELTRELQLVLVPEGDGVALTAYWGAKEYERLAALPYGLQETVSLGFFGILARPLLVGLRWIYEQVVPNYGWAIILMTILIKVLLFPLTHHSYVSMQKMQELQPKMKAIRDRYRGKLRDKKGRMDLEKQRKMNEELTALYRKEGVNPAGGCLPMLLQIPVLFAFYRLLMNAVELRNAPWLLWIGDLASHDPLYVLPIVMGASQFVQQRMTPASADPMQRRMFQLMPVVFTILFLRFPAGLVLYWLTNNVLTIIQQMAYKRYKEAKKAQVGTSKDKRAKAK